MPISFMVCKECGGVFPIRRRACRKRKRGHIKTMYCPWCKKTTQHKERF